MKNPHQLAHDLSKLKWLWNKSKMDISIVTIATLILIIWILIESVESWWAYGVILPLWYCLHLIRWHTLYKQNVQLYHNWEETFGDKFSTKNN